MNKNKDPIAEGIKSGRINAMMCEALKESTFNLQFCQNREECQWLNEYFDSGMGWGDDLRMMINELYCPFCQSEQWIFIGITTDGTMVTATTTEKYGKELNKLILEKRERKNDRLGEISKFS